MLNSTGNAEFCYDNAFSELKCLRNEFTLLEKRFWIVGLVASCGVFRGDWD